ncbi:response regulator [Paenibacillus sp. GD4]|uniref:response regulator transcription factor n=1 Tax=Paenibacillus sp. GD4 TaxID=3068890 RepID=UPI002796A222|nr:response regulator [Paenibacillus sp. GD4]MDQ1914659.1 response regulator [Paenibacillus sp. GD4]
MRGKLLLVEDQIFFRKGLRKMIEDHSLGWEVVGEAENGLEALDLIAQIKPHLVLTDIRMPGMDGIELAESIQRLYPGVDVVILTGYDDFKYAQAAVRFGVIDFLLKPCNDQTLMEVLQKAQERLKSAERQREELAASQRVKEEAQLRGMLLRLPVAQADELHSQLLGKRLLLIAVADFYPAHKSYRPEDLSLLQFALFNIIAELLQQQSVPGRLIALEFDRYAVVIGGQNADGMERQLSEAVRQYLGIELSATLTPAISSLHEATRICDAFLKRHASNQATPPTEPVSGAAGGQRVKELQTQLTGCILLGQNKLEQKLEALLSPMAGQSTEDAKMEALALAFALHQVAKQQLEITAETSGFANQLEQLQLIATAEAAQLWARREAEKFLSSYEEWRQRNNESIVNRALDYLDQHYMESCSLTDTAEMFHVSPAYFSKLFKKVTGDNYSAYLTKLRMQKAVLLLVNTDMKMFEIAAAVGYDDPNYFTNVFRMLHQMSPSDYRKQYKG